MLKSDRIAGNIGTESIMTIRTYLSRLKRITMRYTVLGWFCFVGGGLCMSRFPAAGLVVMLVGFAAFMVGCVYLCWAIRCPNCKTSWGALLSPGGSDSIDPRLQVCPFCRVDLDGPIPENAARNA